MLIQEKSHALHGYVVASKRSLECPQRRDCDNHGQFKPPAHNLLA
jgi:hypothetical protein